MNNHTPPDFGTELNELGQLAAAVGHHVINAFSAIVSNAEVLRQLADSSQSINRLALAETIIRSAVDASEVARRLIDFTRSATAPGAGLVALDRLAARIVSEEQARHPDVREWLLDLSPVPPIHGSEAQLAVMLRHLLDNAREALPPTGGAIVVATGRDEGGWVMLEIRDTGRGMTAEEQERAVEPFFTTKAGRLGVGLSIAHGIWRRHRGTLALHGQPGAGTQVRLCVEPHRPEH